MEKTLNSLTDKLYNPWIRQAGRIAFYLGLLFEIIIFSLDRCSWINPYQSMMFRITFVLFVIKCICTRYDKKQWIAIVLIAVLSIVTYKFSGKDEAVRFGVFVISMKDLDLKRVLRFDYILMSLSVAVLGILAILGIMGEVVSSPGYAEKADAFMLSMGLGSSNTWAIQIWVLVALMLFLYYDRFDTKAYIGIIFGAFALYALSKTSTALIMMIFTGIGGLLIYKSNKLKQSRFIYYIGMLITLACVGFSVFAAKISKWWDFQPEWQRKLDTILTGRITCIYAFENGGGVLKNWKLFGSDIFIEYFDMGIVRMFWWYGIIPGIIIVIAVLYLLYDQYLRKDYMGALLTVSIVIFSVFEAHFISEFLCRNYLLFMFGDLLFRKVKSSDSNRKKSIAFYIGSLSKGGAERVFCNLAEYFVSQNYDVTIITQYKKDNEYVLPDGVNRIISDISPSEEKGRIYNFVARFMKLHHIFLKTDADILLTTIGKNNFMAIVAAIFIRTRIVVSIVADPKEEYVGRIMRFLLQLLFPEADGIVMQTTKSLDFLKLGLANKCVIMPNSIAPSFIMERYEGHRNRDIYVIGRMDENKNQQMAINAYSKIVSKYPDSHLYMVGDGELRDELQGLAESLGISTNVIFTGYVSDIPDRLKKAYMFILTSNSEGMPNTLLEAMALGVCSISTDCPCGGPYDLITNEEDGILVPVNDTDALSAWMDRLLNDYELADKIGKNAYETLKAYRPETVNMRWKSYFENIM